MKAARIAAIGFLAVLAACTGQQSGQSGSSATAGSSLTLVGAGSTFVYPFFSRAFDAYQKVDPGVTINYQSIGSGGGIQQFIAQTVDFGATDVPMNAKDLSAVQGGRNSIVEFPVALGGIAIAYDVPGVASGLVLSPDVLASIYLGTVKTWNDPRIAKLNPSVKLPDLAIVVVHRADASGTTYIFTDYLSAVSAGWKAGVGTSKSVSWPASSSSVGMKGNEGVAGQIKNTPGAIGYVELAYALETQMTYASIINASGAAVAPSIASVRAAAATKPAVDPADFSIVNASGKAAYPIAGYTWALLYKHYSDTPKQAALCDLFHWVETDGQKLAVDVDYVDIPSAVRARAVAALGPCTM
jgi:phosphate transport system substrate-binding protein